jgi:hypothetical protein
VQTITTLLSLVSSSAKKEYEAEVASLIASSMEEAASKLRLIMKSEQQSRRDVETYRAELELETVMYEDAANDVGDSIKIRA